MKLCEETITIFNSTVDRANGYDIYYPTTIKGVSVFCEIASAVDSSGLKAANMFTIRIPVDADFSGKTYLKPVEYADKSNPRRYFTLQQGDIIIRGTEKSSLSPKELQEKYGEIITVLGVTDSRRAPNAKHWKVVGK